MQGAIVVCYGMVGCQCDDQRRSGRGAMGTLHSNGIQKSIQKNCFEVLADVTRFSTLIRQKLFFCYLGSMSGIIRKVTKPAAWDSFWEFSRCFFCVASMRMRMPGFSALNRAMGSGSDVWKMYGTLEMIGKDFSKLGEESASLPFDLGTQMFF